MKIYSIILLLVELLAGLSLVPTSARANIGDFGFGSRTAGMAGANAAWGFDSFSAYSNPAGLPLASGKKLNFGYGWLFMDPSFTPITQVTVENGYNSDQGTNPRTDNVVDDYKSVAGQTVGAAALLAPEWGRLSAGITLFLPFDPLGFTDTGETFIPEYVLYRARSQRPQIELGIGGMIGSRFSLGLGLHVGYGITANATAFLQTAANTTSSMRISASIKPQTSPNLAWLLTSEAPQSEAGSWTVGQVFRMPNSAQATLSLNSSARAFGNLAALDLRFGASSAMFYDPLSLETGISWKHSPNGRFFLQLDFQNWSRFERPALKIEAQENSCSQNQGDPACSPLLVNPTTLPALSLRNVWIPRVAEEITFDFATLRVGYAYRPSIFSSLPTEAGNYLDPSKHIATTGIGWKFPTFWGWNTPASLDLHASYQHLISQQVIKSPGDETGNLSKTKIGAPGYTVGGSLWGGGATLTLEL